MVADYARNRPAGGESDPAVGGAVPTLQSPPHGHMELPFLRTEAVMTKSDRPSRHASHATLAFRRAHFSGRLRNVGADRDPLENALDRYRADHADALAASAAGERNALSALRAAVRRNVRNGRSCSAISTGQMQPRKRSQPALPQPRAAHSGVLAPGPGSSDGLRSPGAGKREFRLGFKHSFWDIENAHHPDSRHGRQRCDP